MLICEVRKDSQVKKSNTKILQESWSDHTWSGMIRQKTVQKIVVSEILH
jgi:hypothetical protein